MLNFSTDQKQTETDDRPHHYQRYRIAVSWSIGCELTPPERLVLFLIASADLGGGSYHKIETMARETGLHRTTVMRALVELQRAGIIYRDGHHRGVVRYRLGVEFLETKLGDKGI